MKKSGIRLYCIIPCDDVQHFLAGEMIRAWPTEPEEGCPGASRKPKDREDREKYFPKGGTLASVDPDKVVVGEYLSGVFTLQKKGAVSPKAADPLDCLPTRVRSGCRPRKDRCIVGNHRRAGDVL